MVFCGTFVCTGKGSVERELLSLHSRERGVGQVRLHLTELDPVDCLVPFGDRDLLKLGQQVFLGGGAGARECSVMISSKLLITTFHELGHHIAPVTLAFFLSPYQEFSKIYKN